MSCQADDDSGAVVRVDSGQAARRENKTLEAHTHAHTDTHFIEFHVTQNTQLH